MAAEFGLWELRLPTSRAVYDDEDEENVQATDLEKVLGSPSFHWLPSFVKNLGNVSEKLQCSLLILGVGEVATSFLQAHLLSAGSETLGLITEEEKKTSFEDLVPEENMDKSCLIYRLNASQDTVICQTKNMHVPAERSFNWTCKIFERLNPSKVMILTSSPACEYHSVAPDSLAADFVKMLKTDSWTAKGFSVDCDFLETPNVIKDLPAAVLSYCQVHNVPAAVFVCYTESSYLDSRSVEAFQFLLGTSHLNSLQQSTDKEVSKFLKSIVAGKLAESNIYI